MTRCLPTLLLAVLGTLALAALAAPPVSRSAFEGYQPFTDEKPVPWPQANETVRQIGGWRAYAREAAQAASAPASGTRPEPAADPHGAHHKP